MDSIGDKILCAISILVLLAMEIGLFYLAMLPPPPQYNETFPLISINNGTNISGDCFLGSGTLSESAGFYFYIKNGKAIQLKFAPAQDSTIYEDSVDESANVNISEYEGMRRLKYEFHVPINSVIRQFSLDVKDI